jgi:DNA-binding transcriptional regulator YiaG
VKASDALLLALARQWAKDGTARRIREAARLAQSDIAAVVGVTGGAVSHWEAGDRVPRGAAGLQYARLLEALRGADGERDSVTTSG